MHERIIRIISIIGVLLLSSHAFAQDSPDKEFKAGKVVVLKSSKTGKKEKLTSADIIQIELLLAKCISANNLNKDEKDTKYLKAFEKYNRQYIPFIKNGQKQVWVNCFCEDLNFFPRWKKEAVSVFDGGNCYFMVLINLDKQEYSQLYINGVG